MKAMAVRAALALILLSFGFGQCHAGAAVPEAARSEMLAVLGTPEPHRGLSVNEKIFDRFIGAWQFDCTYYLDDGTTQEFDGEWSFDRILDGSAIQDMWIGYQEGRAPGRRHMGTTLRFFDAKHDEWRVIFIVPASGKIIMLHGGATGERIVLNGIDVNGNWLRWSFNDMTPDAFVWRGETSYDRGKSWRVEQIMRLRRKRAH